MKRTSRAPLALLALGLALAGAEPSTGPGDPAKAIRALEEQGMDEVAPGEMETARELLDKGEDRLLHLQLELLAAAAAAHDEERRAEEMELAALDAERDVRAEQAAYEFLVEQILASGVASYWSSP